MECTGPCLVCVEKGAQTIISYLPRFHFTKHISPLPLLLFVLTNAPLSLCPLTSSLSPFALSLSQHLSDVIFLQAPFCPPFAPLTFLLLALLLIAHVPLLFSSTAAPTSVTLLNSVTFGTSKHPSGFFVPWPCHFFFIVYFLLHPVSCILCICLCWIHHISYLPLCPLSFFLSFTFDPCSLSF